MAAKTIVAYADGHVDATGPGGFNAAEGITATSVEALAALARTIDLCNERQADILVVPGDLFHTGRPAPEIVARVLTQFERLDTTKVVLIDGNHDQQGVLASHRTALMAYFADRPWCAGAWSEPGVQRIDDIAIACLPWLRVSSSNMLGATNEALARQVDELASAIPEGVPSLFAGHLTLAESTFDSGLRGSEANMVVSTLEASVPAATLEDGPWALARLGHIHRRQQITDKVGYVGSPYKVSFGEAGQDKGVDVITLGEDGSARVEFVQIPGRELIKIDLTDKHHNASFAARPGDIVRIVTTEDTLERAEAMRKTFTAAGAQVNIHRLPKEAVAVQREARYSTEMPPAEAMAAYLSKKGVPEDKRPLVMAAFNDVTNACAH